ncbi:MULTISPECIES: hypothetical protein [Acinetobacter]|uniref:hypothetical protein n=1 Tax=Acinetobacter TaxID=469 RepID=UPI001F3455D3|nr:MULTISPECIES: hypothetical protein [Acinetobacter]UIJ77467.1 hypothetical protein LXF01_17255 [Acinetobacter sp. SH20PTE14]
MNNAQFKIECFRNGLYSPEQIIEFYKVVHTEETKYNSRDAQLWINGKSSREYQIDPKAIQIVDMLNAIRSEVIAKEKGCSWVCLTDEPEGQRYQSKCCVHSAAAGIRRAGCRKRSR